MVVRHAHQGDEVSPLASVNRVGTAGNRDGVHTDACQHRVGAVVQLNGVVTIASVDGVDATGNKVNIPIRADQYWGNAGKYVAAEGFMVNTSWFRIREANISMRLLPKNIIEKTPFGNIEFGIFGRNLFLIAKDYPHLDPEQNALGTSNISGLEFNANPSTRTLGVNLRFTL